MRTPKCRAAGLLLLCSLASNGCGTGLRAEILPTITKTSQELAATTNNRVADAIDKIEHLSQKVDTRSTQISNQIWPIVWLMLGLAALGGLVAVVLNPTSANRKQLGELRTLLRLHST